MHGMTNVWDCEICRALGREIEAWAHYPDEPDAETQFPAEWKLLTEAGGLLRCPACGTFYELSRTYDADPGGGIEHVTLRQLTPPEAMELLKNSPVLRDECARLMENIDAVYRAAPYTAARWLVQHHGRRGEWAKVEELLGDATMSAGALQAVHELVVAGIIPSGGVQRVLASRLGPTSRKNCKPASEVYFTLCRTATSDAFAEALPVVIATLDHEFARRDAAQLLYDHFGPRLQRAKRALAGRKSRGAGPHPPALLESIPVLLRHAAAPIAFETYSPTTGTAALAALQTLAAGSDEAARIIVESCPANAKLLDLARRRLAAKS